MNNKLNLVFKNIAKVEPPKSLNKAILHKIGQERAHKIRTELFISRAGFVGSFLILFYTASAFGKTILESEFWNLASLIFSDLNIVASHWQQFSYSLLETMPVTSIIVILLPIFVFMLSFNFYLNLRQGGKRQHA